MIRGKRINIRPVKEDDMEQIFQWSTDNICSYFMLEGIGVRSLTEMLYHYQEQTVKELLIETNAPSPLSIGLVKICAIIPRDRKTEVFIKIFDKRFLFTEESKEALSLLLQHFFNEENIGRIYTWFLETEQKDIELLTQSGFKIEGLLREELFFNGMYHNLVVLGLLEEEIKCSE